MVSLMRILCLPLLLGALLVASAPHASAQSCFDSYAFATQADLDGFPCSDVNGNILIGLADLDSTSNIQSLVPLSELRSVTGDLTISANDSLETLTGLGSLEEVGILRVTFNDALTSFRELGPIASVGVLDVRDNGALTSLEGLETLEIAEDVTITNNDNLTSLAGLSSLQFATETFTVSRNDNLTSLEGLEKLEAGGFFSIVANASLTSLEGLESLRASGITLTISSNPALTSLRGLDSLRTVSFEFFLLNNDALTSLDGLNALERTLSSAYIQRNEALTNLDALANLTSVGDELVITDNPALTDCSCGLYDLITNGGVDGPITIENNGVGCSSLAEIEPPPPGSCATATASEDDPLPAGIALSIFPNPAQGSARLRAEIYTPTHATLTVYDLLGRRVATLVDGVVAEPLDVRLGALVPGTYLVRLTTQDLTAGLPATTTQRVTLLR
ncbi:MAG: T9SS type A sorting domain-containing protein [Bacteroidota bacterium]